MKKMITKVMMTVVLLSLTTMAEAQRMDKDGYRIKGNVALFQGKAIREADVRTFVVLGYGYAKDCENVYLNGKVLPWVDPVTFSLKKGNGNHGHGNYRPNHGGGNRHDNECQGSYNNRYYEKYVVTSFDVYYAGKKLSDASASSFKNLGYGYGKDAFNVYYRGKRINDASGSSFRLLEHGYSKDAFNVYYYGEKLNDASASSFKVDDDGYAHDAFSMYYYGKEIK